MIYNICTTQYHSVCRYIGQLFRCNIVWYACKLSIRHWWPCNILVILVMHFGLLTSKGLWSVWLSNLLTLSVFDEDYYSKNTSCAVWYISVFLFQIYVIEIFMLIQERIKQLVLFSRRLPVTNKNFGSK